MAGWGKRYIVKPRLSFEKNETKETEAEMFGMAIGQREE